MAGEDLQGLAAEPGLDRLVVPPSNPLRPPEPLAGAIGRGASAIADWIATPGRAMQPQQPKTSGQWSDEDEAIQQLNQQHLRDWAAGTAFGTVFDPVPAIAARAAAPAGSYALRNMRVTPVDHDPFVGETALGVFAGPNAKTANRMKLDLARSMEANGLNEEQIWKQTGWFRGADKKWRFEISDAPAKFNIGEHRQVRPMGEVVEHPELYAAYPDLKNIRTETFHESGAGYHSPRTSEKAPKSEKIRVPTGDTIYDPIVLAGGKVYDPFPRDPSSSRSVALHELQHAIQSREGFATGGNSEEMRPLVAEQVAKNPALRGQADDIAREAYMRLGGEVESRNVATRAHGDFDHLPPWYTEDRPRPKQIVRDVKLTPIDYDPFK